jgi:hypothetical protein
MPLICDNCQVENRLEIACYVHDALAVFCGPCGLADKTWHALRGDAVIERVRCDAHGLYIERTFKHGVRNRMEET